MFPKVLFVSLILSVCCVAGCRSNEQFMLAFVDDQSPSRTHVRWSRDGRTWQDGAVLADNAPTGVSCAASPDGVSRIIGMRVGNALFLRSGLGPSNWDQMVGPIVPQGSAGGSPQASSTPSIVWHSSNKWLVAFRTPNNEIGVRIYNSSTMKFQDDELAPSDALNGDVSGQPVLVRGLNNFVLMTWKNSKNEIRAAVSSDIVASPPVWTVTAVQLNGQPLKAHGPLALSFYPFIGFELFFVANRNVGGAEATGVQCVISGDGITFGEFDPFQHSPIDKSVARIGTGHQTIGNQVLVGLGDRDDRDFFRVRTNNDNNWIFVDADTVFGGAHPRQGAISLIATGRTE